MRLSLFIAAILTLNSLIFSPIAWAAIEMDSPACKVSTGYVKDPDPPLNVRTSPEVRPDNILFSLPNGQPVEVVERRGEWFLVKEPGKEKTG